MTNDKTAWGLVFLGAIALSIYQAGIFGQNVLNLGGFSLFGRFEVKLDAIAL